MAIAVAVERLQGLETIGCLAAVGQPGFAAEQFRAGIDAPVAVEVANQKTIVHARPTGALGEAVTGVVKVGAGFGSCGFDAIAVEVKDDRGGNGFGVVEVVFGTFDIVVFERSSIDVPKGLLEIEAQRIMTLEPSISTLVKLGNGILHILRRGKLLIDPNAQPPGGEPVQKTFRIQIMRKVSWKCPWIIFFVCNQIASI